MAKAVVTHVSGLNLKNPEAQMEITLDDQHLIIIETGFAGFKKTVDNTFRIPLSNIVDSLVTTDTEYFEKQKSVVGRGAVGGVLGLATGGLLFLPGVILGGLSGLGKKTKSKVNQIYILSFVASDGEHKGLTFTMPKIMVSVTKSFDSDLKRKLATIEKSDAVKQLSQATQPKDTVL